MSNHEALPEPYFDSVWAFAPPERHPVASCKEEIGSNVAVKLIEQQKDNRPKQQQGFDLLGPRISWLSAKPWSDTCHKEELVRPLKRARGGLWGIEIL